MFLFCNEFHEDYLTPQMIETENNYGLLNDILLFMKWRKQYHMITKLQFRANSLSRVSICTVGSRCSLSGSLLNRYKHFGRTRCPKSVFILCRKNNRSKYLAHLQFSDGASGYGGEVKLSLCVMKPNVMKSEWRYNSTFS